MPSHIFKSAGAFSMFMKALLNEDGDLDLIIEPSDEVILNGKPIGAHVHDSKGRPTGSYIDLLVDGSARYSGGIGFQPGHGPLTTRTVSRVVMDPEGFVTKYMKEGKISGLRGAARVHAYKPGMYPHPNVPYGDLSDRILEKR